MLTITFIVSLLILTAMVGFKWVEEKKGKKLFLERLRKHIDVLVIKIISKFRIFFGILDGKNRKLFIMFFVVVLLRIASGIKRRISLKKIKFLNSLRVSGNLEKSGSASFFLKNVSEYKNKHLK